MILKKISEWETRFIF